MVSFTVEENSSYTQQEEQSKQLSKSTGATQFLRLVRSMYIIQNSRQSKSLHLTLK